jgi:hypothetical protein
VSEPAPTGSFAANGKGVPQATYPKTNSASHYMGPAIGIVFDGLSLTLLMYLFTSTL